MAASDAFNSASPDPAPTPEQMARQIFDELYRREIGDDSPADIPLVRRLINQGAALSTYIDEIEQSIAELIMSYPDVADEVADMPQYRGAALVFTAALERQETKRIRELLEGGPVDWAQTDARGYSALMHAAKRGYPDIVRILADSDPDLNRLDQRGWNALMHAAFAGEVGVSETLIAKKISVTQRAPLGYTALDLALVGAPPDPNNPDFPPVLTAARSDLAVLLARNGADINEKNEKGISPVEYLKMNNETGSLEEVLVAHTEWKEELKRNSSGLLNDVQAPAPARFRKIARPSV